MSGVGNPMSDLAEPIWGLGNPMSDLGDPVSDLVEATSERGGPQRDLGGRPFRPVHYVASARQRAVSTECSESCYPSSPQFPAVFSQLGPFAYSHPTGIA